MTTYRRPLSHRLAESLAGAFFSILDHEADAITAGIAAAIVGVCIVCTMVVIGNLP